jgi:thiol-disulfide isomerase/thioredoxin
MSTTARLANRSRRAPRETEKTAGIAKDFTGTAVLRSRQSRIRERNSMVFFRAPRIASGYLVLVMSALLLHNGASAGEGAAPLDLSAYRGKVVIVDFWASWCVPCRRSFPWLDQMQRKYGEDGLVVIGVNEDDASDDARAFLQAFPVSFRIVEDQKGAMAREFDLAAMPSSYIFDRDGELAARHLGFKTAKQDEYEAVLKRLLEPGMAASNNEN